MNAPAAPPMPNLGSAKKSRGRKALLWLAIILLVLLVASAGAGFFAWRWLQATVPAANGEIKHAQLTDAVEIKRDNYGVPSIQAQNAHDAYFALGFVHAQDRFWQMEIMRRLATGRLAEIAGSKLVGRDKYMRLLNLTAAAQSSLKYLTPPTRQALAAYTAGVNAWLTSGAPLAPELALLRLKPEPWQEWHCLLWSQLMSEMLSGSKQDIERMLLANKLSADDMQDLFPNSAPATTPPTTTLGATEQLLKLAQALPPAFGPSSASNWFAATPQNTAGNATLLANDPHLQLTLPTLWYVVRIDSPELYFTGATAPGVPLPLLGQSRGGAWGLTTTNAQVTELQKLELTTDNKYKTAQGEKALTTREEIIKVRDASPVLFIARDSDFGPVLSDLADAQTTPLQTANSVLVLNGYVAYQQDTTADALRLLAQASTIADFFYAMGEWRTPVQNIIFADRVGNIAVKTVGLVPLRTAPPPSTPAPATKMSPVPFADLPQKVNPDGFAYNANNAVTTENDPWFISSRYEQPWRAERISELLNRSAQHTPDNFATILNDTVSLPARDLLPILLPFLLEAEGLNSTAQQANQLLLDWDLQMNADAAAPLIFETWLHKLHGALFAAKLGANMQFYATPRPEAILRILLEQPRWCESNSSNAKAEMANPATANPTPTCNQLIVNSYTQAIQELADQYGSNPSLWRWGKAHFVELNHPVFSLIPVMGRYFKKSITSHGGQHTINRGAHYGDSSTSPFQNNHAAGYRAIYDLGDPANSRFMISTGQSGNPWSPHYLDMLNSWRNGKYITLAEPASPDRWLLLPAMPANKASELTPDN